MKILITLSVMFCNFTIEKSADPVVKTIVGGRGEVLGREYKRSKKKIVFKNNEQKFCNQKRVIRKNE